ncbi:acyl-CoA N-acyltransferase, partial [Mycena rosella]
LVLRAPVEADDEAMSSLWNDPATTRFMRNLPGFSEFSLADVRARRLEETAGSTAMPLNIYTRDGNAPQQFVGMVRLHHIERSLSNSCEIGVIMRPKHFAAGLGREAVHAALEYMFEEEKIHRVVARTAGDNAVVRGWTERLATFEGVEREHWTDGQGGYTDV